MTSLLFCCVLFCSTIYTLKSQYVSGNAVCQCNKWAHIKVWCALFDLRQKLPCQLVEDKYETQAYMRLCCFTFYLGKILVYIFVEKLSNLNKAKGFFTQRVKTET